MHRLLATAVGNLGGSIGRAVIVERVINTYSARLIVRQGDREFPLFARPIDAILAATIAGSPILVVDSLF